MSESKFKIGVKVNYLEGLYLVSGEITNQCSFNDQTHYEVGGKWIPESKLSSYVEPLTPINTPVTPAYELIDTLLRKVTAIEKLLQNVEEKRKQEMKEYLDGMFSPRFTDPRTKATISPKNLQKIGPIPYADVWFNDVKNDKTSYLWEDVVHFDGHGNVWDEIYASIPKPSEVGAYTGKYNNLKNDVPAVVLLYEEWGRPLQGQLFII